MSTTARERACGAYDSVSDVEKSKLMLLTSSRGAYALPYLLMPLRSPSACLKAVAQKGACISEGKDHKLSVVHLLQAPGRNPQRSDDRLSRGRHCISSAETCLASEITY